MASFLSVFSELRLFGIFICGYIPALGFSGNVYRKDLVGNVIHAVI